MKTIRMYCNGQPVYTRENVQMTVEDLRKRLDLTDRQVALHDYISAYLAALEHAVRTYPHVDSSRDEHTLDIIADIRSILHGNG